MARTINFELTDKVVIVTGAGRGIGKVIAQSCAEYGADLALGSRTVSELEPTAEYCRAQGRRAEVWPLDVANVESIRSFVNNVLNTFGRIDVLVNNAGVNTPKPAFEYTEEEFDLIADVNFKGAYFMSTLVAQSMVERNVEGSIITVTSQAGVVGGPLRSVYGAAKAAANHFTKTFAAEWAPNKITVNAVAPTFTRTPMLEAALKSEAFAKNLEKVPMGRVAEPEEIAGAVIYLASPAARMVTGQVLAVDGGFTAV